MRLIDADSIKFTEYVNGDITVSKEAIEKMPTAYDVDKVVERLEEERNFLFDENGRCYSARESITIDRAIEIVKSGGIE